MVAHFADALQDPDLAESGAFVELDAGRVLGEDAGLEIPNTSRLAFGDQELKDDLADVLATMALRLKGV